MERVNERWDEKKAAPYLGVSVKWLQQARCQGRGPKYIKIGKCVRYNVADLDAYIASRTVNPSA